eukprot:3492931-Lingulodinium_polyedra.AAC.1
MDLRKTFDIVARPWLLAVLAAVGVLGPILVTYQAFRARLLARHGLGGGLGETHHRNKCIPHGLP